MLPVITFDSYRLGAVEWLVKCIDQFPVDWKCAVPKMPVPPGPDPPFFEWDSAPLRYAWIRTNDHTFFKTKKSQKPGSAI